MKKRFLACFMLLSLLLSTLTFNFVLGTETDAIVDNSSDLEEPDPSEKENPDEGTNEDTELETATAKAEDIPITMDKNTILTSNLQGSSTIENATLTYIIVEQPANAHLFIQTNHLPISRIHLI